MPRGIWNVSSDPESAVVIAQLSPSFDQTHRTVLTIENSSDNTVHVLRPSKDEVAVHGKTSVTLSGAGTCIVRGDGGAANGVYELVMTRIKRQNPRIPPADPNVPRPQGSRFADYIDGPSGTVTTPLGDNPFGDGVWRSSWFYASLLVIFHRDRALYDAIAAPHGVDVGLIPKYLAFLANSIESTGWAVPGNVEQGFSNDQLVPLLFLMACVAEFARGTAEFNSCSSILDKILDREKDGRPVHGNWITTRNIGYVIDVLCEDRRYGKDYVTPDQGWVIFHQPVYYTETIKIFGHKVNAPRVRMEERKFPTFDKGTRRGWYKTNFEIALQAQQLSVQSGAFIEDFAIFNAIGIVSIMALIYGTSDSDVDRWRKNFRVMADKQWGPAFRIAAGRSWSSDQIDAYLDAYVDRSVDNDVLLAQRGKSLADGSKAALGPGEGRKVILDYVVLNALRLIWA